MTKPRGGRRSLMPHVERGAERGAVVAGGRLDVDLAERRVLADLAVGDAVHRAAAGQAQPRLPASRACTPSQHVERGLLEDRLQRRGDGLVSRRRPARRGGAPAEQLLELSV